ncbi:hypothetical protein D9758_007459 [Tetrapyrgos nigripes]|uniref:Uncharacterized protein n=1 Tax=Tetrapyrgos nigripes TaxID=182062 RepID=A0A8H5LHE5_9AGAR|nr:hypothetical protein D9758_007459 [Tetrapyrgos nigripes]
MHTRRSENSVVEPDLPRLPRILDPRLALSSLQYHLPCCVYLNMSINDPAGVSALLERLRSSQAWRDAIGTSITSNTTTAQLPATSSTVPPGPTPQIQDQDENITSDDLTPETSPAPPSTVDTPVGSGRGIGDASPSSDSQFSSTLPSPSGASASSSTSVSIASLLSQLQPVPTQAGQDSELGSSLPLASSRIDRDRHHAHTRTPANAHAPTLPNTHTNPNPNPNPNLTPNHFNHQHSGPGGVNYTIPTQSASSSSVSSSSPSLNIENDIGIWQWSSSDGQTQSAIQSHTHSKSQFQFHDTHASEVLLQGPVPVATPQVADRRRFTFQQALPVVAKLSEDEAFIKALASMKKEQEKLEHRLWEERGAIIRKYEDKVKTAVTKATITGGTGISKHEAAMLTDACKKELRRFDSERALVAWDGLITQQQEHLARLGVPTMFVTDVAADRETQQKVTQVLEGLT